MSGRNRRPSETATALNQKFLNDSQDNLVQNLNIVASIEATPGFGKIYRGVASENSLVFRSHPFVENEKIFIQSSNSLNSDGEYFAVNVTGSTIQLSESEAGPPIPLPQGEEVTASTGRPEIRVSNKNIYVEKRFHEARVKFAGNFIKRSVGELFSPRIKFSSLNLEINNIDGKLSPLLPGGEYYTGLSNKTILVRLGLRDLGSTYTPIFRGSVTPLGGFKRGTSKLNLIARDQFDKLETQFPLEEFRKEEFPDINETLIGRAIPFILGDYSVNVEPMGRVPAFVVNSEQEGLQDGNGQIELVISANRLAPLNTQEIYLVRGDNHFRIPQGAISVSENQNRFTISQPAGFEIDGEEFKFEKTDQFTTKPKSPDEPYRDNPIEQARQILIRYGGARLEDFHQNWNELRDKEAPEVSAIRNIRSRVWVQRQQSALQYALSLLEQIRVEFFVSKDLTLKLLPLHFEEFNPNPSHRIKNFDIERNSIKVSTDDNNIFNAARASFDFNPVTSENGLQTRTFINQKAIDQMGKTIAKDIEFPNLIEESTVINQLKEILKLASSYREYLDFNATSRSLLTDIGDFVMVNISISATTFKETPMMVRGTGIDPKLKIPLRLLSFQMIPFPGWEPEISGIVGGFNGQIE